MGTSSDKAKVKREDQKMTEQEYLEARRSLDAFNKAIDDAPITAKPVFKGIAELHAAVTKYERQHGLR